MSFERMSLEQFRQALGRQSPKYGNVKVVVDGIRFDSKLEGMRYLYWYNLWRAGAVLYFLRQVPFHLPGNIIYRVDFVVVGLEPAGLGHWITYEDCKGHMTRVSENKIKQVEAIYKIRVDLIAKGGKPWVKPKAKSSKTKMTVKRRSSPKSTDCTSSP